MFGRKKKAQKREEHQQSLRKGLLFWLRGAPPGWMSMWITV